jgi:hypothetical protein
MPASSIRLTIACKTSGPLKLSNSLAAFFASIAVKPRTSAKSWNPPPPVAKNSETFSLVSFDISPIFSSDMPTVLAANE